MSMQKRKFTKEEKLQILEESKNQWGKSHIGEVRHLSCHILQLAEEI